MTATLTNAPNFRDLGGIPIGDGRRIRTGQIFRSGVLDALDGDDHAVLAGFGVRTVIDLRADGERSSRPNTLPPDVRDVHHAVTDVSAHPEEIMARLARGDTEGIGAEMLLAGNRHFVEQQAARFGGVVRMLFDPSRRPAVVHCTAGKDRTGFAVACVLWALGADHEVVVGDYLRTNDLMQARHDRWLREATARGIAAEPLDAIMRVRREYIDAARDAAVARFGSVDRFVRDGLGVSDALRGAAREQLLVPR